ncbi:NAD-dependent epimerase/dehydratase family protein [Litoreibacter janthinus]|uniref:Uronate dehydrogenase n=1 Tax=Litoreibacter janthinus TaxID=670154 RepID=A0A1I6G785_9RHOB|nr:NAD(P)-dependent oxidoreductase [Litoreibacter janthinus]SFR37907.1 uronate dehydrogenase [Litoreibacter janthinus]
MKKIVLTGAAGNLGKVLRGPLAAMCDELLSTDIAPSVGELAVNETFVQADLADMAQIRPLLEGADMVVHFGAIVDELPFEDLWGPNFVGSYNIWQAAKEHGVRRVVYASSIHAMGMYPKTVAITPDMPHRPDTYYGLAKCFSEDLGRMYWEKEGIESVHIRILSAIPRPGNARALGTWLSFDDLTQVVTRAIDTPVVGFTVIYGVSNNDRSPVDNSSASHLGYSPNDNGEEYAEAILAETGPADLNDLGLTCHGGPFASAKLGVSPMALMGIPDDD